MNTIELTSFFDERYAEVDAFVDLLTDLERATQHGAPQIKHIDATISPVQLRILYSTVYLQLYNLVEATVSQCVAAVTDATADSQWYPGDLIQELRTEWVRAVARTSIEQNAPKRLDYAVALCDHLLAKLPMSAFKVEIGGGGNWDDVAIESFGVRLGLRLRAKMKRKARSDALRPVRDDFNALRLVKDRRNRLAHGAISFFDCADGVTVQELVDLAAVVGAYLREAIACFVAFIDSFEFVVPDRKPAGAA